MHLFIPILIIPFDFFFLGVNIKYLRIIDQNDQLKGENSNDLISLKYMYSTYDKNGIVFGQLGMNNKRK